MNKKSLLAIAASTLMFAACGDDVTEIHQDGMAVLEKGEKLSKQACDTTNVGEMLFVMDSSEAFICDGESWQTLKGVDGKNGENGTSCTVKKSDDKSVITCTDAKGKVVSTAEVKDGENGEDGLSCSVEKKGGKSVITCTDAKGKVVSTAEVKDGENGEDGLSCSVEKKGGKSVISCTDAKGNVVTSAEVKDGENGEPCLVSDNNDGTMTITCGEDETTLYKAMCGTAAYDPAKSFCSEGKLYSCDDKPYDPKKQFCKQGSTVKDYGWLTDTRDKQIYKTVKIGDQTWMAENLNYSVNPGEQSWCGGGEADKKNEGDCSVYGRLYTWAAAVGKTEAECGYGHECDLTEPVQGVCPEGWHLPSKDEWKALFTAVGGTSYAGQKLKADSDLWYEGTSNDDSFGFAVLPAGHRDNNGSFRSEGYNADFWSSTEGSSSSADYWYFGYGYDNVYYYCDNKYFGFSVRCLQNN